MKVSNIINDRGNRAVNQFVIKGNNGTYFQSYDSVIALYTRGTLYVTPLWDFSNTTRKHFYIFVRDYCYGYHADRKSIIDGINSGSIKLVHDGDLDL